MHVFSTLVGKSILKVLRLSGRTGSALPGLAIEKIDKHYLPTMLATLPRGVVVVSGTNGKTTTTKILAALLASQGLRVLTNPTGSNFVRGIVSAVADNATVRGRLPYDIAVFEQDEAHAVHFARQVQPRGVVILNVMRDQMDRFGEIDTTLKMLQTLAASATDWVVLNANDERVSTLAPAEGVATIWYAHARDLQTDFLTDDQLHHGESVAYHLAGPPSLELLSYNADGITVQDGSGKQRRYDCRLPGSHNAINLTAALAAVQAVVPVYDDTALAASLRTLTPAFGRGEIIDIPGGGSITLQLIKNPGGCTHALRMLDLTHYDHVAIAINDDYPDGRDVSWLWDVDFRPVGARTTAVLCGGTRAADMANRLKYDDVAVTAVLPELERFVDAINQACAAGTMHAIVYCTYTAMLKIRGLYLGIHSGLDEGGV